MPCMLYADDLIIADISSAKLQERFGEWQEALERKGLKVNADKTEPSQPGLPYLVRDARYSEDATDVIIPFLVSQGKAENPS